MIKAVIFDIDGTLLDSNRAHAESFAEAFEQFGKNVSYDELKRLIGMGADDILEKYLTGDEIREFGERLKKYRTELYLADYFPSVEPFPKVRELFEKLEADKMQTALATSAGEKELEKYHQKLRLGDLYEKETNADDTDEAKPAPDIFLAAFNKLKEINKDLNKDEVLVVGDTPYDAEAARRAGLQIVGVESGGWSAEKLLEKGCAKVFRDVAEMLEQYEQIFGN